MDAIRVSSLVKTFRTGVGRARLREMLPSPIDALVRRAAPRWWTKDTFNALDDVSFTVPRGGTVGVVGHNGAGKTTLLKVIAGVTEPSSGSIRSVGRMGALVDVMVGFHGDLTAVENACLLGAVYGHSRKEMLARREQILDFAEIEHIADTPLKRCSSGTIARLGFATLSALDLDTLLVDEILAVGDASFQRKCIRWLDDYRSRGGTLVFVSHNLALVRNMTDRAVWLDGGRVVADGRTPAVLADYARAMEHRDGGRPASVQAASRAAAQRGLNRWGAGGARVEHVHIDETVNGAGELDVSITYEASAEGPGVFCIGFIDEAGRDVGVSASPPMELARTDGEVRCSIRLPLRSGIYFPVVAIVAPDGLVRDRWRLDRAIIVDREGEPAFWDDFGPVTIEGAWGASNRGGVVPAVGRRR